MVYKALCKPLNVEVAIKCIDLDKTTADIEDIQVNPLFFFLVPLFVCTYAVYGLQNEMLVMRTCRHENVISYYTSFVTESHLWVVMRLAECGSVLDVLKYKTSLGESFDEVTIATILKYTLEGLNYFHAQGKIHRSVPNPTQQKRKKKRKKKREEEATILVHRFR